MRVNVRNQQLQESCVFMGCLTFGVSVQWDIFGLFGLLNNGPSKTQKSTLWMVFSLTYCDVFTEINVSRSILFYLHFSSFLYRDVVKYYFWPRQLK